MCPFKIPICWLQLHFTLIAGLIFAVSGISFITSSRMGKPASEQRIENFMFRPELTEPEHPVPWWRDYRVQAGVLLALKIALLTLFW